MILTSLIALITSAPPLQPGWDDSRKGNLVEGYPVNGKGDPVGPPFFVPCPDVI